QIVNKATNDKVIEILQRTDDGHRLSPSHLTLLQLALNDNLSDKGLQQLNQIHDRVMAGVYVTPWFCGIEHLIQRHDGYVLFKGKVVEHYSSSDSVAAKDEAIRLVNRCLNVEARGYPISGRTTSSATAFVGAPGGSKWLDAMMSYYIFLVVDGQCKAAIFYVGEKQRTKRMPISGAMAIQRIGPNEFEMACHRDVVDLYHQIGRKMPGAHMRHINTYGIFCNSMREIGLTPEQFVQFSNEALARIPSDQV
ncbi:unnamed protein product, partial [marine sediment metagenome]